MSRRAVWLLLLGWLPLLALFTTLIATVHGIPVAASGLVALRSLITAAIIGSAIPRITQRLPWTSPLSARFIGLHAMFAVAYAILWIALNSVIESILHAQLVITVGPGFGPTFVTGVWLYVMIAVVSYMMRATERTSRAEASAAKARLATLKAQLHPHFLFNALHSVVHLIPREPERAARASEELAELLRTSIEEERDLITVAEEWRFVERYLSIEDIRFGERLVVISRIADEATTLLVPPFALQTLVENAVRHAATPSVDPTTLTIDIRAEANHLVLSVSDSGSGVTEAGLATSTGTGLRRLRERLHALFGDQAGLLLVRDVRGFTVELRLPRREESE